MSDLLATLGITTPKPDPKAYENQKEIAAQLDAVRKDLTSTISSVELALKTAALVGFKSDLTTQIEAEVEDTKKLLLDVAITPDQLEKKRLALESRLTAYQEEQKTALAQNATKDVAAAVDQIQARHDAILADSGTSEGLKKQFEDLLAKAKKSSDAVKTQGVRATSEPDFVPAGRLLSELDELNASKEYEEQKDFSVSRFLKRTMHRMAGVMLILSVVVGGLLGGSILANTFAGEPFWGMKVYYFVYGAIFFPIPLLMGCLSPPDWYGTLGPFYKRATPQANSLFEKLFSYANLTPEQAAEFRPAEKESLRILSILTTGVLGGLAWYYDVKGYLKRGG